MTVPRVALSLLTLVTGGMGGSETYARELMAQLAASDRVEAFSLVPGGAAGFSGAMPERVVARLNGGASTLSRLSTVATATRRGPEIRQLMVDADVVHYPFTVGGPCCTEGSSPPPHRKA
jgi:hypothetical protein